jgi:hypothetical protein
MVTPRIGFAHLAFGEAGKDRVFLAENAAADEDAFGAVAGGPAKVEAGDLDAPANELKEVPDPLAAPAEKSLRAQHLWRKAGEHSLEPGAVDGPAGSPRKRLEPVLGDVAGFHLASSQARSMFAGSQARSILASSHARFLLGGAASGACREQKVAPLERRGA